VGDAAGHPLGLAARALGHADAALAQRRLIRHIYDRKTFLTMSAYDFLRRWFVSPDVIAVLGFYVSMSGSLLGLTSPGSASS